MKHASWMMALGCFLHAATAGAAQPDPNGAYARFAGAAVPSIQFDSLRGWEPLDAEHLVLFTEFTEAWLLELSGDCLDVDMVFRITLTHQDRQLLGGTDTLRVGQRACAINNIRPVDLPAYRMAKREVEGASLEAGQASELRHAELAARPAPNQPD